MDVPLRSIISDLLVNYRHIEVRDSQHFTGLMLQLSLALDRNPDEVCSVYQMSQGRSRRRTITREGKIASQLFQGANPSTGADQGSIYPGDRHIRADGNITIQVHRLDLTNAEDGPVVAPDVMVLAVWVPRRLEAAWLVQDRA